MTKLVEAAKKYFGLTDAEADFIETRKHGQFYVWGADTNKTKVGLVTSILGAMEGKHVLFLSPTFVASKNASADARKLIPEWVQDFLLSEIAANGDIAFKNGGSLTFASKPPAGAFFAETFVDKWRQFDDIDELKRELFPVSGFVVGIT